MLGDEKRRSNSDSNKLTELQALFANSMKSYNEAVEHAKQLGTSSSHVLTNPEFYICNQKYSLLYFCLQLFFQEKKITVILAFYNS